MRCIGVKKKNKKQNKKSGRLTLIRDHDISRGKLEKDAVLRAVPHIQCRLKTKKQSYSMSHSANPLTENETTCLRCGSDSGVTYLRSSR